MIAVALAFLTTGLAPAPALAGGRAEPSAEPLGMLEVRVQVDGLSCPFCAYGLEKKLRRVDNVAELEIQVDEGRAVVTPAPGTSVDLAQLERAVRDGGFTPRELQVTARGRLTELGGVPALELPDGVLLLLVEDARLAELRQRRGGGLAQAAGPVVRVQGLATRHSAESHADPSYTLAIQTLEPR
jgi:copper chaperone CopZ